MEAYSAFAYVYDSFMEEVPYDEWADFIVSFLRKRGMKTDLVLDLGCGTGEITRRLGEAGFDMTAIDVSGSMLQVAREKYPQALYLCQDAAEFELYGTVGAIVSTCDSLNYILEPDRLREVFRLANNYLEEGGYFIFDLNTPYKYRELLADNTFAEDRGDSAFIWDNLYDEDTRINEYALSLFISEDGGGIFRKEQEVHLERCYTLREIKALLEEAGMEFVECHADYTDRLLAEGEDENSAMTAERMVVIARERRHEGKFYLKSDG